MEIRLSLMLAAVVGVGFAAVAANYYVTPDGSGNRSGVSLVNAVASIQAAIDLAQDGDTIHVDRGSYAPILTAGRLIEITSLYGPNETFINGGGVTNCCIFWGDDSDSTNGVLVGFTLHNGFSTTIGAGAQGGTLKRCIIRDNRAIGNGGGAFMSSLENCLIYDNTSDLGYGAGIAECQAINCTITANKARNSGGAYRGVLYNCIVWGNNAAFPSDIHSSASYNTCSSGRYLMTGSGNIDVDPRWVNAEAKDFRLRVGSLCINSGTNEFAAGSSDFGGNARIVDGTVDMGAFEGGVSGYVITTLVQGHGAVEPTYAVVEEHGEVSFHIVGTNLQFNYFSTNYVFAASTTNFTWQNITKDGVLSLFFDALIFHVDGTNGDDQNSGLSWDQSLRTIQAAIDLTYDGVGDAIWVTNGVYAPIVTDNKSILIQSVNGAAVTTIDANYQSCAALLGYSEYYNGTILNGFTITRGWAESGAGVVGGSLTNCVLVHNTASVEGGGAFHSYLQNCTVKNNNADYGGGVSACSVINSVIENNTGFIKGGGAYNCYLYQCNVRLNDSYIGGGVSHSSCERCTITYNEVTEHGGGANQALLYNTLLFGNDCTYEGGGAIDSKLYNCTVAMNYAGYDGGGVMNSEIYNTIVWSNVCFMYDDDIGGLFIAKHSCSPSLTN